MTRRVLMVLWFGLFLPVIANAQTRTLFLAHYDGNTAHDGMDADYAKGSAIATFTREFPSLSKPGYLGDGALHLDWWGGRSINYQAKDNINPAAGCIEMMVNVASVWLPTDKKKDYGSRKNHYVLTTDQGWGKPGHFQLWFNGDPKNDEHMWLRADYFTDKLVALGGGKIHKPTDVTKAWMHLAFQWDATKGLTMLLVDGVVKAKFTGKPWKPMPSQNFRVGADITGNSALCGMLDMLRISDRPVYDIARKVGQKIGDVPVEPFSNPNPAALLRQSANPISIAILNSRFRNQFKHDVALSDPQVIAQTLRAAGYAVKLIDDDTLADLDAKQSPLVVLPQGPYFPQKAVESFIHYLQAGGSFFSTGGYAFDQLYDEQGGTLPAFGPNLVRNFGFEDGLTGWQMNKVEGVSVELDQSHATQGRQSLHVQLNSKKTSWAQINSDPISVVAGQTYTFHMAINTAKISGGVGAYGMIHFMDSAGKPVVVHRKKKNFRTGFVPANQSREDEYWTVKAPAKATKARVALLLNGQGEAWFDQITVQADYRQRLNSHWGTEDPHILRIRNTQIPIFDISNPLRRVDQVSVANGQTMLKKLSLPNMENLTGIAASAMLGNGDPVHCLPTHRRRIPLLLGYDRIGQCRGSLLSVAYNYDGPYSKSAWLFSGVTSQDLFAAGSPLLTALPKLIERLLDRTFMAYAMPSEASFRPGESPSVDVRIVRQANADATVSLHAELWDKDTQQLVQTQSMDIPLNAQSDAMHRIRFGADNLNSSRYRVRLTLHQKTTGLTIDQLDSGFVIWRGAEALASRANLQYQNNYFKLNGKQQYLLGANQTGILFVSPYQTPETWDNEIGKMADNGLKIYRVLHTSPMANLNYKHWRDKLDLSNPSDKYLRKLDALVTICAMHDVVLMLEVSNANGLQPLQQDEIFNQQGVTFVSKIAQRYKPFRGMILDLRNEPHMQWHHHYHPQQLEHYTQMLISRYGSRDAIAKNWQTQLPDEGSIKLLPSIAGSPWGSLRGIDQDRFIEDAFARYMVPRCDQIRKIDPDRVTTMGFTSARQSWQFRQVSHPMTLFNRHDTPATRDVLLGLKWTDMRYAGKSASFGEFQGTMFPSWRKIQNNIYDDQSYAQMLHQYSLLAFGMGFSFINKWSINDLPESYFPHGLLYSQDGVHKLGFDTYANSAWILSQLQPVYQEPRVGLLIPTTHLRGTRSADVLAMINQAQKALLGLNVPYVMVDEDSFRSINPVMDTLIAPVPMTMTDDLFQRLLTFVKKSGKLFLSGDLSYDPMRHDTQGQRLVELCGVKRIGGRRYADIQLTLKNKVEIDNSPFAWKHAMPGMTVKSTDAKPLAWTTQNHPVLFEHTLGQGKVIFICDLFEAADQATVAAGYQWFLQEQAQIHMPPSVYDTGVNHFVQHGNHGQQYHVFRNDPDQMASYRIMVNKHHYQLQMAPRSMALLAVDKTGQAIVMQVKGSVCMDGKQLMQSTGDVAVIKMMGQLGVSAFEPGIVMINQDWAGNVKSITQMNRLLTKTLDQIASETQGKYCKINLDWQSLAGPLILKLK